MSDWLNPIFVLKTRHYYVFLRQNAIALLGLYLFVFYLSRQFFSLNAYDPSEMHKSCEAFVFLEYVFVGFFCAVSAVLQMDLLPKRYIDEDLIHYTALTDKQVLFGYIYVGTFYSGLICVCGTLVHLLVLPGLESGGWISFAYFFSFFLISQMLCLFCASFFAGVRKRSEFIAMGFVMYITFFLLFSYLLFWDRPISVLRSFAENPRDYWNCIMLYVPAVAGCAYCLIHWNLQRRTPLPFKMARTFFVYAILAGGLYLTRYLLEHGG